MTYRKTVILVFRSKMASYFDEHDCEPLREGQGPDHFLHFARLLIDSGNWNQGEFAAIFQDRTPPPTSKKFLDDLKDHLVRSEGIIYQFFYYLFLFPDYLPL